MNVSFYGHVRQYHNIKGEIDANIQKVLESGQYVMGPMLKKFEAELAAFGPVPDGLDIQELVNQSGVPRRTIYFYVQQGLLPPPEGAADASDLVQVTRALVSRNAEVILDRRDHVLGAHVCEVSAKVARGHFAFRQRKRGTVR